MTPNSRETRLLFLLEGCGAGILLMFRYMWLHLSPVHVDLYHRFLPMNSVYGGIAIDLALLVALCAGVFWLIEHFDSDGRTLLWVIVGTIIFTQAWALVVWLGYLDVHLIKPVVLSLICIAAGVILWWWQRRIYRNAVLFLRVMLALLGVCVLWILPQLIYMAVHREPYDVEKLVRALPQGQMPQRRIIWIVFDELSQDQTFDHRQPDITLPALDRFRSQSVMFSDVQPAGYYTELVLPSLLWGKTVTDERSDLDGNLFVKTSSHKWEFFPANETVFADARREGWSTGVAGWYNPYCRTYGAWLDWCAWTLHYSIPGDYLQGKTLWWNANAPLVREEMKLTGGSYRAPLNAGMHAADYDDLMRWSHELIDDEQIGFVFLHLPLPHPGGFYNRKTGKLGVNGSYLDNLALTDHSLAELMQWIGETSLASKTTVVLCSDHSWRVPMWRVSPMWTKEDALVSDGRFDPRPVLMVHFPGETSSEIVTQPFNALREHDFIEYLLRRPMNASALDSWRGE